MITFKELLEGKFDKSAVKDHIKSMSPEMFRKLYGKSKAEIRNDLKEDIEQIDELSKGTLASYAKKATTDAVIKRKIAGDFETMSDRSRKPGMKQAADVNAQKYKEQSWKRRHGVEKAIDRLAKEHIELEEAAPFKKLEHAVAYATDKVKTHRDNLDGIEVYKHSGGYDVNHTMNASGRNSLNKIGAKHLGTVYKDKPTNIKEEAGLEEQAPVAPVPDKKYIKGTPENKAHKEKNKPINGHPTNKMKEETMKTFNQLISSIQEETWTDEQIVEQLNSLTEEDLQGLSIDVLEALAEAVRVYDISKSNQGTKPKTPEDRKKAAAAVKAARANKPKDNYTGKSVTGAGSAGAGARQAGKTPSHIAVKEETESVEEGFFKGTGEVIKQAVRVPYRAAKRVAGAVLDTAKDVGDAAKNIKKKFKEEVELEEGFVNGREYASHGLMHPDHAKMDIHKVSGDSVDFYASKTGDKMHGKVTKNDGKQVHIQAHKELGDGKLHKFKVSSSLPKQNNEAFENGELETSMKSYKDFLTSIDEALWPGTPEYKKKFPETSRGKVGSETKTSYGTNTVTSTGVRHERDYDKAEKETTEQPTGNMAKRGRGRPAGSKSGARR